MLGMPPETPLTFGSYSGDPAMRDLRMTSHLAKYSGVSFGAFSERPSRPSSTSTGRGGGKAPPRVAAAVAAAGGGAAARPPRAWPNGSIGEYTPVKSGGDVPCARSDAVDTNSTHRSAEENEATVFDMMCFLSAITEPRARSAARPRFHQRASRA